MRPRTYDLGVSSTGAKPLEAPSAPTRGPRAIRSGPPPLHGGPLTLLRFARRNHMLTVGYGRLVGKRLWLKLPWRGRLRTDRRCFGWPGVKIEIRKQLAPTLGR